MFPFGDGSSGALNVASTTSLPLNTKLQYTTVNVQAGATLTTNSTVGSVLYIMATESITIDGTVNVSNKVGYGDNTWSVTIDGDTYTSPGVKNGGNGAWFTGSVQGKQSRGFGGGGGGAGVLLSGTTYLGGNGGTATGSDPNGGNTASVVRSSNGITSDRNNGTSGGGGSGIGIVRIQNLTGSITGRSNGGRGGETFGDDGADGSNSYSGSGSAALFNFAGGGGGAGGRAGRAGVHVVLISPTITINGTVITSGTNGTDGGNGGESHSPGNNPDGNYALGGGGGGGGNAGNLIVKYGIDFTAGTHTANGGSAGDGGRGGVDNTVFAPNGTNGSAGALIESQIAPLSNFTANVTSGTRPLTVNFTNLSQGATSYLWNFGDGNTSTATNPTHNYTTVGSFTVTLTATNDAGNNVNTKTAYITTTIATYTRSISGTLLFSGGADRYFAGKRSISGTLMFSGGARAVILTNAENLQDKTYLYKVYDENGNFIEVWKDVISELNYTHEINSIGSTTNVELARNSDTVGTVTAPLLTEADEVIVTEDDYDILVSTSSRNQIGSGSSVDYNNRVDIYVYYGSVEPLLTEGLEEILTEDNEQILAEVGAPNGRRIFTGFISEINTVYGNSDSTKVQLTSYGFDLDQYIITNVSNQTTVAYNTQDPSAIARSLVDRFVTISTAEQTTYTNRTSVSIPNTSTSVSYTFRANTFKDGLDKTLELMPSNWYYRVGLGDNIVYYNQRSSEPRHLFFLGKHIKALDLRGSILDVVNDTLFSGGGDPALYIRRTEAPATRTRRGLSVASDSRVTLSSSAQVISDTLIADNNKVLYRTSIEILSKQYDIETINAGDTVGFRNFDNYVDGLIMQVVGLTYQPDYVQLQLETKPPTINKRLEDIRRNLTVTENMNVPNTPS